jgi:hypothetical protein
MVGDVGLNLSEDGCLGFGLGRFGFGGFGFGWSLRGGPTVQVFHQQVDERFAAVGVGVELGWRSEGA